MTRRRTFVQGLAALAALGAVRPGLAQPAPAPQYDGPDRAKRLLEGAKREGGLTVYSSMAEKDLQRIVAAFERKFGLKTQVWRSGKNRVLQRALTEARAGRYEADVIHNPAPEMEALRREALLQPVRSPVQRNLLASAVPAHGEWTAARVYIFVQAYNTQKVGADELPKAWTDLTQSRWKGRLGIEAKEQEWFRTLVKALGEEQGIRLFRDIAATNGFSVRNGHALLNNLVISGEVPLALSLYSYLPEQAKRNGAPIDWFALPPSIAYTDAVGVARNTSRPHAAVLFYDFMLSDGQTLMAELQHVTTQKSSEALLARFKPIYIDPTTVLDDYDKWTSIYEATIAGRASG